MLQAKAVNIQRKAQYFAQNAEIQDIKEEVQRVMIAAHAPGQRAERVGPAGNQQHDEKTEAQNHVSDVQPALGAVVFPHLSSIGLLVGFSHGHCACFSALNSTVTNCIGCVVLFTRVCATPPPDIQATSPDARLTALLDEPSSCVSSRSETGT